MASLTNWFSVASRCIATVSSHFLKVELGLVSGVIEAKSKAGVCAKDAGKVPGEV